MSDWPILEHLLCCRQRMLEWLVFFPHLVVPVLKFLQGSSWKIFCASSAGRSWRSFFSHGLRQVRFWEWRGFFSGFNVVVDFLYCVDLLSWPKITFCSLCLLSPIRKRDFLRMPNFWTLFVIKGWRFGFFVVFLCSKFAVKKKHGCGDFSQSCTSSAQLFDLQQAFSSAKVRKISVRFFYLKKKGLDLSCIMLKLECRWQTEPSRDE
jgi:hypothetical protein